MEISDNKMRSIFYFIHFSLARLQNKFLKYLYSFSSQKKKLVLKDNKMQRNKKQFIDPTIKISDKCEIRACCHCLELSLEFSFRFIFNLI